MYSEKPPGYNFKNFAKPFSGIINEPVHEISIKVVCATIKASDQPAFASRLIFFLNVNLLTEHH